MSLLLSLYTKPSTAQPLLTVYGAISASDATLPECTGRMKARSMRMGSGEMLSAGLDK